MFNSSKDSENAKSTLHKMNSAPLSIYFNLYYYYFFQNPLWRCKRAKAKKMSHAS